MLYALYKPDGSIWQANQVYDQPNYGKVLAEHEQGDFLELNSPTLISSDRWFVDTKLKELVERPPMPIEVSTAKIKAGAGAALLTKIPPNANVEVRAAGAVIHAGLMDATELELHIPVPCVYTVRFSLFPYKDFEINIEAYA